MRGSGCTTVSERRCPIQPYSRWRVWGSHGCGRHRARPRLPPRRRSRRGRRRMLPRQSTLAGEHAMPASGCTCLSRACWPMPTCHRSCTLALHTLPRPRPSLPRRVLNNTVHHRPTGRHGVCRTIAPRPHGPGHDYEPAWAIRRLTSAAACSLLRLRYCRELWRS